MGVAAQRADLVAIRPRDAALSRRWHTRTRDRLREEFHAIQAQRALWHAFLDLVLNLELRDHHGELTLTVMRLGREVALQAEHHPFIVHQHRLSLRSEVSSRHQRVSHRPPRRSPG